MPRRSASRGCLAGALVLTGLLAVGAVGVLLAGQGLGALGPADPRLPPLQRAYLTAYLLLRSGAIDRPAGSPSVSATLDVEPGQDARSVAEQLARLDVLHEPGLFVAYARYRGLDTRIEAGRFEVDGSMTVRNLAEHLQQATTSRFTVTIPEGLRREQIARLVGDLGLGFSAADFLAATRNPPPPTSEAPAGAANLEGFLFPDTYTFDPRMSATEAVELMTDNFQSHVGPDLVEGLAAHGLTVFQGITLASIVEREAVLPSERPVIASVFFNRLARGIPLQSDPTVQYALGWEDPEGYWKPDLTAADLQIDSPYNTYLYGGLPPGPIANPGLDSIEAVAHPARTDYLFFRAACDGSGAHRFASTFDEHVANACP
jgi:UPF0755 protein